MDLEDQACAGIASTGSSDEQACVGIASTGPSEEEACARASLPPSTTPAMSMAATKRIPSLPIGCQILSKYRCRSQSVTAFSYAASSARKKCA